MDIYCVTINCALVGSSDQLLNYTLTERNGMIYAFCSSQTSGIESCKIEYSMDSSYSNLSRPVVGPVNTLFHVCFTKPTRSLSPGFCGDQLIIVRSSNDDENASFPNLLFKLQVYQLGLLGLLFIIMLLTSVISIGILVCKGNNYYCKACLTCKQH